MCNAVKDFELDRKLGNLRYFPEKNRGLSEISLHDVAIKAPFFLETTQINAEKILGSTGDPGRSVWELRKTVEVEVTAWPGAA